MSNTALTSAVLRRVADLLEPLGWRRKAGWDGDLFERAADGKLRARFNYSLASYRNPTRIIVTPYVEVAHEDVESARKFITGRSLYTLNAQIQTLMGDPSAHMEWVFVHGQDHGLAARRLVSDWVTHGSPFADQFRDLADIVAWLERRTRGERTVMRQSLAIAYCLQGKHDSALAVLAEYAAQARRNPRDPSNTQLPRYRDLFDLPASL
jgi:hypothetical protein